VAYWPTNAKPEFNPRVTPLPSVKYQSRETDRAGVEAGEVMSVGQQVVDGGDEGIGLGEGGGF
jgi:hypothetical protein